MDQKTDFAHFKKAILDFEDCPNSPVAKQTFNNWRHHCFMNYPVGEVLKFQAEVYAEIKQSPVTTPRYPRRFTTSQHC